MAIASRSTSHYSLDVGPFVGQIRNFRSENFLKSENIYKKPVMNLWIKMLLVFFYFHPILFIIFCSLFCKLNQTAWASCLRCTNTHKFASNCFSWSNLLQSSDPSTGGARMPPTQPWAQLLAEKVSGPPVETAWWEGSRRWNITWGSNVPPLMHLCCSRMGGRVKKKQRSGCS